jgi:prepilin-type N-terminal cleavage/methylation domain-containing protein
MMNPGRHRGFSLVEILVVVAIIALLAAFLLPNYIGGAKGTDGKRIQSPRQRARGSVCRSNLSQVRQAYTMATSVGDETRPTSIADLRSYGVSDAISRCPDGKQPYQLDPATGRVSCVHPGHERY